MAGFSSQGPIDVDFRVKPDVVAPVTMGAAKGAVVGGHSGSLELTAGGSPVAHAVLYTSIK